MTFAAFAFLLLGPLWIAMLWAVFRAERWQRREAAYWATVTDLAGRGFAVPDLAGLLAWSRANPPRLDKLRQWHPPAVRRQRAAMRRVARAALRG